MSDHIPLKQLPKGSPLGVDFIESNDTSSYSLPHRHEYYEIVWALEGTGSHSIDFVQYPLNEGDIYFVSLGQVHSHTKTNGRVCIIIFQPDFIEQSYRGQLSIDQTFYNKTSAPYIKLDQYASDDFKNMLKIMTQELGRLESTINWDLIGAMLNGMLQYSLRFTPDDLQSKSLIQQRMYRLYILIDNHYRTEKKTDFYAQQLAISNKRANEIARQHSGKTISKLLHERIILEARRELAFTTNTVKQIAHDLGYDDVAYFCRFFRKVANESPLDFRARVFK
ncbi:helix-turn-helix transcriptional regulator [Photobacterium makurazakiensis]|uniref:helix-turn-helix domain-containing protein n=1 Tax=Photobacterium makurazakiensis TaxID=2910234 RepID=UPI003D128B2A